MQHTLSKYIVRIAENVLEEDLKSGQAILLVGARQVGKTKLIRRMLEFGKTVFLDFDLETDQERFLAAASQPAKGAADSFENPDFLVMDNAQRLPESVRIVKQWHKSGFPAKCVLMACPCFLPTGLPVDKTEEIDRKRILPPLTFWEIVRAQPWYLSAFGPDGMKEHFASQLESLLLDCMAYGHYPETLYASDKSSYLTNLVSSMLWKDLLLMGHRKTADILRLILTLVVHQTEADVSINELSKRSGLARATVERYLEQLEQAFVIFRLPAFHSDPRREICKSQKVFFWDTGIRNAFLNDFSAHPLRSDIQSLWENWVVAEFARQNVLSGLKRQLFFWRSRSGAEVHLIVRTDERLNAFEIHWNPQKASVRGFSKRYGVPVRVIDRTRPLFQIDSLK